MINNCFYCSPVLIKQMLIVNIVFVSPAMWGDLWAHQEDVYQVTAVNLPAHKETSGKQLTAFVVLISGILQDSFRYCNTWPHVGIQMLLYLNLESFSPFCETLPWKLNVFIHVYVGTGEHKWQLIAFYCWNFFFLDQWFDLFFSTKIKTPNIEMFLIRPRRTLSVTNL